MKIIAEVFKLAGGSLIPQLYGLRDDGSVDRAVTDTLLDVISESRYEELQKLDALLTKVESGHYRAANTELPDWSSNDKNIWMTAPRVRVGTIAVSNENVPELAFDGGQPQEYAISVVKGIIRHWLQFQQQLANVGAGNMIGQRFETSI